MNWMFNRSSPLRSSLRKYSFSLSSKLPEGACLEVFKTHWHQAYSIIEKCGNWQQHNPPTADDVSSVINNLDQMITLLIQEMQQPPVVVTTNFSSPEAAGPLLNYLMAEGCLDKLLTWSTRTLEFINILKHEQLKFYEILVTNCHQDLLFHKPIVRPLLRLLASCGDCAPLEVCLEKRLVILLNTLCDKISKIPDLVHVFFGASPEHGSTRSDKRDMFLIFSLLIPFVHREGAIGQQARDALLLCMSLSRRNESIGNYIAEQSNFCPVLATGLSGLYSLLPRKLPDVAEDWHGFTNEDIASNPELAMFLNSLEFCNAVTQAAHPLVQEQLMEYLYQGFLVPVLGPALHQNTVEEIVATTAYLELFLRNITEPILIQMFHKFVLTASYDGHRVLSSLVDRLGAQSRLCLINMALFNTLLQQNCEDVLFELVFRYLIPCTHVMVSQRSRVRDMDLYNQAADKFLSLIPASSLQTNGYPGNMTTSQSVSYPSDFTSLPNHQSLPPAALRSVGGSLRIKRPQRSPSTTSLAFGDLERSCKTDWYVNLPETESSPIQPSSYMDYLRDAHRNVKTCTLACKCWSSAYDGLDPPPNAVIEPFDTNELRTPVHRVIITATTEHPPPDKESSSVLELSTENVAVLQDSLKQQECLEKQVEVDEKTENETISSDVLQRIVTAEEEGLFWRLVNSTDTPDIEDDDDIEGYFKNLTIRETPTPPEVHLCYTEVPDCSKDECSNADSGVFESRDSEKDSNESAKPNDSNTNLFIAIPIKTELKATTCSSGASTKSNSPASPGSWESFGTPNIGPFLSILLTRLEMMMQNDVYTNLHLTGILSRLACYPQPLLRSFLLNPSLVFQPTVRSLIQVLGSLKQKVDSYSSTLDNYDELVSQSKQFLSSRLQNQAQPFPNPPVRMHSTTFSDFQRGDSRRRSLTNFLYRKTSFLRNRDSNLRNEPVLESTADGRGYRYIHKPSSLNLDENELESAKARNAILCAVILEEFLKELAAIAQEHSIIHLNPDFWNDIDAPWD